MDKIGHFIGDKYRNIATNFMDVLKESQFYKEGVLTPEEFVKAGDYLTSKCPTWKWSSNKNNIQSKDYLPPNKQYLITTVPSINRVNFYKNPKYNESQCEDDWTYTEFEGICKKDVKDVEDIDIDDKPRKIIINSIDNYLGIEGIEEIPNKNIKEDNIIDGIEEINDIHIVEVNEDDVVKSRTYDVSMNYDYYYRVPRMWLTGYSETGTPLNDNEMKEDIMLDYIDKTVTIENHPCTGVKSISIHPCKHSMLIKSMINQYERAGKTLDVEKSLVLFLKFLSSIVPTIKYDFTLDVEI